MTPKTAQKTAAPKAASKAESGRTVLLVGGGGREHALATRLACSPSVARLICAPGSDAWRLEHPGVEYWPFSLKKSDFPGLAGKARSEGVTLAVIGPDNPLADGIADV